MRHEDIDDHQIEGHAFESAKSGFAAIGNRHLKAVSFEIDLNGHANHWIIIDNQNTRHGRPPNLSLSLG